MLGSAPANPPQSFLPFFQDLRAVRTLHGVGRRKEKRGKGNSKKKCGRKSERPEIKIRQSEADVSCTIIGCQSPLSLSCSMSHLHPLFFSPPAICSLTKKAMLFCPQNQKDFFPRPLSSLRSSSLVQPPLEDGRSDGKHAILHPRRYEGGKELFCKCHLRRKRGMG